MLAASGVNSGDTANLRSVTCEAQVQTQMVLQHDQAADALAEVAMHFSTAVPGTPQDARYALLNPEFVPVCMLSFAESLFNLVSSLIQESRRRMSRRPCSRPLPEAEFQLRAVLFPPSARHHTVTIVRAKTGRPSSNGPQQTRQRNMCSGCPTAVWGQRRRCSATCKWHAGRWGPSSCRWRSYSAAAPVVAVTVAAAARVIYICSRSGILFSMILPQTQI